jgi:hypothetical protein
MLPLGRCGSGGIEPIPGRSPCAPGSCFSSPFPSPFTQPQGMRSGWAPSSVFRWNVAPPSPLRPHACAVSMPSRGWMFAPIRLQPNFDLLASGHPRLAEGARPRGPVGGPGYTLQRMPHYRRVRPGGPGGAHLVHGAHLRSVTRSRPGPASQASRWGRAHENASPPCEDGSKRVKLPRLRALRTRRDAQRRQWMACIVELPAQPTPMGISILSAPHSLPAGAPSKYGTTR